MAMNSSHPIAHIYISVTWVSIGLDNGLSPIQHLEISSTKWRPISLGGDELIVQ